MKIWNPKWNRYVYLLILKKPLSANRLAAIKQGKAWLRVKEKPADNLLFNVAPPKEEKE